MTPRILLYLLQENTITMGMEAWFALAGIFITLGGGLITIWVRTRSDIDVMKSEIATLRDMISSQIQTEKEISKTLGELSSMIARIDGRMESKQDK